MIGLVDSSDTDRRDDDFDTGFGGANRSSGRSGGNNNFDDEFYDEPRMSRPQQPRRERTASNNHGSTHDNQQFDADEGWNEPSSGRPEYGARNQQRAQTGARPASGRYGSNPGSGTARSNPRPESGRAGDNGYQRGSSSSYQHDGYQAGSYRAKSNSSYGGYGTSSRRTDTDKSSYYSSPAPEQNQHSNPLHQTSIFKIRSVDECKEVILALLDKKSVLLNMDELDSLQAQRTLDTMSGATYAIGARLSRASDRTWLITPNTVEVDDGQHNDSGSRYGGRYI
ncbi:MAG: cell division protein SepF [Clostridia bacterium]|nr:cell division protein SepF [Clostridia bacterium]